MSENARQRKWKKYEADEGFTLKFLEPQLVIDAVIREMKEETGLDIQNPRLCGIKQFPIENGRYIVFLFHTDEFSGEVTYCPDRKMVTQ